MRVTWIVFACGCGARSSAPEVSDAGWPALDAAADAPDAAAPCEPPDAGATWSWRVETIEGTRDGGRTALGVGPDGTVRVAYRAGNDLRLATREGPGAWSYESVARFGRYVGGFGDMALAPDGTPHVCYQDADNDVHHAVRGDGWEDEQVEDLGVGESVGCAIALDGAPHLTYARAGALVHATDATGEWVSETVDDHGVVAEHTGFDSELAIDASGGLHVSYRDDQVVGSVEVHEALRYARSWDGGWTTETVDDSGDVRGTAIALDPYGNPFIGYQVGYRAALAERYQKGGWSGQVVPFDETSESGNSGRGISIAIDPHPDFQAVHLVGCAWNGFDEEGVDLGFELRHYERSYRSGMKGPEWRMDVVAHSEDRPICSGTSTRVDVAGVVHVSYRDATSVRYARFGPEEPECE